MHLLFEPNKIENTVRIFQVNGLNKVRIASYDLGKDKIILKPIYRRNLELQGIDIKEACNVLFTEYNNWRYTTSPLRNLSKEQIAKLLKDMKAINILSVCFQDYITSLSVLDDLDKFGEVTKDLRELKDNILSFTKKVSAVVGVDNTIEVSDTADEINEYLIKRI